LGEPAAPGRGPDLELDVRAFGRSLAADGADDLAGQPRLSFLDHDAAEVQVEGVEAAAVADHDARPVTLERTGHDDGARFHRPDFGSGVRGDPDPVPAQRHAVRAPLGAEPVDEASIDRPVEGPDVGRGNGPFGDGAASDGATPFFLEPPALEFGDEAGESRLVALELGAPPLRLL